MHLRGQQFTGGFMRSTETLTPVTDRARRVLKDMSRWNIVPSPQNYHVWFEYLSGDNVELTGAVNSVIASGEGFNNEILDGLYRRHIGDEKQRVALKRLQRATQTVLRDVLEQLIEVGGAANKYKEKLEFYSGRLETANDTLAIRDVVKSLLHDTAEMTSASIRLQGCLEETTSRGQALERQLEKVEQETLSDNLTGLGNRRAAEQIMSELCEVYKESGEMFSVIVLDLDQFKKVNDAHGHAVGDAVLCKVARSLQDNVKGRDFIARHAGEEFTVILPQTASGPATVVADQLREALAAKRLRIAETDEDLGSVTASFGIAEIRPDDTEHSLFARAKRALESAKAAGGDTVKSDFDL